MGKRFRTAFPNRTDFQSVLYIFAVFIIALFVSEILTVFIDLPSVDLSKWIERKILKDTRWTLKDICYSVPYWPYNVAYFFYSKTLICFCNFHWVITCAFKNVLTIWKSILGLLMKIVVMNGKNDAKENKQSVDTVFLISPESPGSISENVNTIVQCASENQEFRV